MQLGDNTQEFNFGQEEIFNINKLIKILRNKLQSTGKTKAKDVNDNIIYVDHDIFTIDQIVIALQASLNRFQGLIPEIEESTFFNGDFCLFFSYVLVSGAILELLFGQNLKESWESNTMTSLYQIESHNYREEIKLIRDNLPFYKKYFNLTSD